MLGFKFSLSMTVSITAQSLIFNVYGISEIDLITEDDHDDTPEET